MLAESMAREREEIVVREKAQSQVGVVRLPCTPVRKPFSKGRGVRQSGYGTEHLSWFIACVRTVVQDCLEPDLVPDPRLSLSLTWFRTHVYH